MDTSPVRHVLGRRIFAHRFAHFHLATVSSFEGADTVVATRQGLNVVTKPITLVLPAALWPDSLAREQVLQL